MWLRRYDEKPCRKKILFNICLVYFLHNLKRHLHDWAKLTKTAWHHASVQCLKLVAAANIKRAGFHWTTPVSLMASLWSQREPADRQRRHGATLPRVWPNPALCLVCFGARRVCKHTNKCVSTHPCSYCPSCFTPAASLPEPNTRRSIPCGLFQRVCSLLRPTSVQS